MPYWAFLGYMWSRILDNVKQFATLGQLAKLAGGIKSRMILSLHFLAPCANFFKLRYVHVQTVIVLPLKLTQKNSANYWRGGAINKEKRLSSAVKRYRLFFALKRPSPRPARQSAVFSTVLAKTATLMVNNYLQRNKKDDIRRHDVNWVCQRVRVKGKICVALSK